MDLGSEPNLVLSKHDRNRSNYRYSDHSDEVTWQCTNTNLFKRSNYLVYQKCFAINPLEPTEVFQEGYRH